LQAHSATAAWHNSENLYKNVLQAFINKRKQLSFFMKNKFDEKRNAASPPAISTNHCAGMTNQGVALPAKQSSGIQSVSNW